MERQIVGFILGTFLLVLVILITFYILSYASSKSVEVNDRGFVSWVADGLSNAWSGGDWSPGQAPKKIYDSGAYHYAVFFMTPDVVNYVSGLNICGETDNKCYTKSISFDTCSGVKTYCLCLIRTKLDAFTPNIASDNCNKISSDEIGILKSIINEGSFNIVYCKSLDYSGVSPDNITYKGACVYSISQMTFDHKIKRVKDSLVIE